MNCDYKNLDIPLEQATKLIMECNNYFINGEFLYLGKNQKNDIKIRMLFPKASEITEQEKAGHLLKFNECQKISRLLKLYMEQYNCGG